MVAVLRQAQQPVEASTLALVGRAVADADLGLMHEPLPAAASVLPLPGSAVSDADLELAHEPLPADEVVAGSPTTAIAVLDDTGDREIGIWEMTPGTARDTETDELFVVLSGRATIAFEDPSLPDLSVGPGSVVRLAEGMRTVWAVTETLRKVYIA